MAATILADVGTLRNFSYFIVTFTSVKFDPVNSPENWNFSFGEQTNTGTNYYFALNRVLLFKGMVQMKKIQATDLISSENNNNLCTMELTGAEHMICLECIDSVHAILPGKIACVPLTHRGMF
jgi:hypothetical protein